MIKRIFDIIFSGLGIILLLPIFVPVILLVYLQDFHSPFYIAERVGKFGKTFKMFKIRSMIIGAENTGVQSTGSQDNRITPLGKFIRRFKLDELSQLINVFMGTMSFVGPRPNTKEEVALYSRVEMGLVTVKPGITDFSSIVFSDEGEILADKDNPDLSYNQLIRPWKSRLGLVYINNQTLIIDIKLILLTIVSMFNKPLALNLIAKELMKAEVDSVIIQMCRRENELLPYPPPGMTNIVKNR